MPIHLKCLAPRPMASLRLICIPHAGAGALTFRPWMALLPAHVEVYAVQLPGREDRIRESPLVAWPAMMGALAEAIRPLPLMPTAVFGHSLGAVIGLELARWMHRDQPGRLVHLFVSGRPWPGNPAPEDHAFRNLLAGGSDEALLQELDRRYGSMATNLAHPEIRELMMPVLRADLRLLAAHRHAPAPPLECPLTVFAGTEDHTTPIASLDGWSSETRGETMVRMLEGQHFFLESHRHLLLDEIARAL